MRHASIALICVLIAFSSNAAQPTSAPTTPLALRLRGAEPSRLAGRGAHMQVVATLEDGKSSLDATHTAKFTVSPAGIVTVDSTGLLTAQSNGVATLTATTDGAAATLQVTVEKCEAPLPINFANQIVPIFTKDSCNGGGCHGKLAGQNGFRLSLLGFEPRDDYEHLVYESRGRRLSPAAPEHSLLLLKSTGLLPHGGGKRMDVGSDDYNLIVRWISQGMPIGEATDPTVASIEIFPATRTIALDGEQQLQVTARYTDGSTQDVTRDAVFQSGDKAMATVDATGHVVALRQPGSVAVMVRYQGKVAAFQAMLPLGAPVDQLPPTRNFIDELVFGRLKALGMPPSGMSDDATFVRRVMLDVAGRLPTIDESTSFVADKDSSKRDKLIDRLLDGADYADYFANTWSALLRNKRTAALNQRGNYLFHDWIRDSLYANKPYDQFVGEILTASGNVAHDPPAEWFRHVTTPTTELEDTAQLFLGTRMQCAQCHHHPYDKWSQQDYFSLSAFFSQVAREPAAGGEEIVYTRRAVPGATNVRTGKPAPPAGLGAKPVTLTADDDARAALVDWMVSPDNRFFAPALVNRYWKHFMNRGLVEPEDDMRETNPATNPQLLAALSKHFIDSKFDLKELVRTICRSSTYQLSALPNEHNAADRQNYSRFYPKRLNAEVLLDAVDGVTGSAPAFEELPAGTRAVQLPDNSFNAASYFLTVFGRPEASSACECERSQDASLAQSLHLLNSKDVMAKIAADGGRAAHLATDASKPDAQKVREIYLLAMSREPTPEELSTADSYLTRIPSTQPTEARRARYEDVLWAILNTKEFLFNH